MENQRLRGEALALRDRRDADELDPDELRSAVAGLNARLDQLLARPAVHVHHHGNRKQMFDT